MFRLIGCGNVFMEVSDISGRVSLIRLFSCLNRRGNVFLGIADLLLSSPTIQECTFKQLSMHERKKHQGIDTGESNLEAKTRMIYVRFISGDDINEKTRTQIVTIHHFSSGYFLQVWQNNARDPVTQALGVQPTRRI